MSIWLVILGILLVLIKNKSRIDRMIYRFDKTLYSRIAVLKASYNYTNKAYVHLDSDEEYYIVELEMKQDEDNVSEKEFENEMLAQSVRHEIYLQTKNIRELMLARALATTVVADIDVEEESELQEDEYSENEILKDWFSADDES